MDFIETLTAIVKEVIKDPAFTIENDKIECLVKRSDNHRDFTNRVLYEWTYRYTQKEKSQVKMELLERLYPLQPDFEKLRIERDRLKVESDLLNIILKELRELKEYNRSILKELTEQNSSILEK